MWYCYYVYIFIFIIYFGLKFGGSVKSAVKKIALFPHLWAIIFGFFLNLVNVPIGPVLDNTINYLGNGAIPLIMLSLGISIDLAAIKRSRSMIIFTSIMKLLFFLLLLS